MRRIIERVVTVVTTTTWTIYWKEDPPPPGAEPGMENEAWLLLADEAQHLLENKEPSTIKEADGLEKGTPKIS